jgi:hypothetical protein
MAIDTWTGVLPLQRVRAAPIPAEGAGDAPAYIQQWQHRAG